jgi:hypothetical protein
MPKKKVVAKRSAAVKPVKKVVKLPVKPLKPVPGTAGKAATRTGAVPGPKKGTIKKKVALKKSDKVVQTPAAAAKPVAPKPASPAPRPEHSLGRPLVTQEEKLYMLFHDDYQCRQVFEFLRVETVKDLEQFTAQQIVHLMSRPIRMTVDRIRQRLAQFKRSLKDDEQFAAGVQQAGQSAVK